MRYQSSGPDLQKHIIPSSVGYLECNAHLRKLLSKQSLLKTATDGEGKQLKNYTLIFLMVFSPQLLIELCI